MFFKYINYIYKNKKVNRKWFDFGLEKIILFDIDYFINCI